MTPAGDAFRKQGLWSPGQQRQTSPMEKCILWTSQTLQNQCNTNVLVKGEGGQTLEEPFICTGLKLSPPVQAEGQHLALEQH